MTDFANSRHHDLWFFASVEKYNEKVEKAKRNLKKKASNFIKIPQNLPPTSPVLGGPPKSSIQSKL